MKSRWPDAYCYVAGCGVDCHAMNFQPFGVCVQALRNTRLKLRGWPLISASIAARPVTSAVSHARRTLRSLQVSLPAARFVTRQEVPHGRNIWQHLQRGRGGHGQRAKFPGSDVFDRLR